MCCNRARPLWAGPLPSSGASVARPAVDQSNEATDDDNHHAALPSEPRSTPLHRTSRDAHATLEPRADQDRSLLHESAGLPGDEVRGARVGVDDPGTLRAQSTVAMRSG